MSEGKARFKRFVVYCTGWFFIVLGVLGVFLPILQGILFLLIGLMLLSGSSPRAARLLGYIRARFPKLSKRLDEAAARAGKVQARIALRFDSKKSNDFHKQPGPL